jgi:hypothetical protein
VMCKRNTSLCVIPGELCEAKRGKGIHQARVCASKVSLRPADAARMGSLPLAAPGRE